jgi:hypothetical protein
LFSAISNASELHYDAFGFAFSSPCSRWVKKLQKFLRIFSPRRRLAAFAVQNDFTPHRLFAFDSLSALGVVLSLKTVSKP